MLEEEVEPFLHDFTPLIFVNYSFERVPVGRECYSISEPVNIGDLGRRLERCPWGHYLTRVLWKPKPYKFDGGHKKMEQGDNAPYLVDYSFTVLTAIHLAVCMGFKSIFGAGVNLATFPDGRYAYSATGKEHKESIRAVFEGLRWKYGSLVVPDLYRLGVKFVSKGLL